MWKTLDGCVLMLPREGMNNLARRMGALGMTQLIQAAHHGDLYKAIVRATGQLARSARRAGLLRHLPTRRQYPIFVAETDNGNYQIITRQLGNGQYSIVSIQREPDAEFMTRDTVVKTKINAQLNWTGLLSVEEAKKRGAGKIGQYVIYKRLDGNRWVARNNGESRRDLGERLRKLFEVAQHKLDEDLSDYRVRLGIMDSSQNLRPVEHALRVL